MIAASIRGALRFLRSSPAFTAAAVTTLAVGIGANTAIFSFVEALLLRPLPFPDPDRLVRIESLRGGEPGKLMPREWEELDRDTATFAGVSGWYPSQYNLIVDGRPEVVRACMTTANLFRVLGVPPALGSSWEEGTHRQRNPVLVLSHDLWRNRLGGRADIVRQTLTLDYSPYQVTGVARPGFDFPGRNDVYRAAQLGGAQNNDVRSLFVVARLRPGVSLAQAESRLASFAAEQAARFPASNSDIRFRLLPLREAYVGEIRPYLLLTLALAALVLLIACANVVNLLLARGVARGREFAVRAALGAGQGRIAAQLLAESLVLHLAGALAGLALAFPAMRLLRASLRAELPPWMDVRLAAPVLLFTFGVALACGIAAGLYPALAAGRVDLQTALREGGRGSSGGRLQGRIRQALILAELALAVVLSISAGLLARSYAAIGSIDTGFNRAGILTFRTDPPWARYNTVEQTAPFYWLAQERLAAIPGVTAVAANHSLPLAVNQNYGKPTVVVEGQGIDEQRRNPFVNVQIVSSNYFEVLRIPLLAGRGFGPGDRVGSPPTVVLSRPLAERLFGTASPIGRRVRLPELLGSLTSRQQDWFEVIGVAEGVRSEALLARPGMDLYLSNQQQFAGDTFFVLRTPRRTDALARQAAEAVRAVDAGQPIFAARYFDDLAAETVWQRRIAGQLGLCFGLIALLLAAIGTYSLLAYAVSQRGRELAIRQALGSPPEQVRALVVKEGMRLAAAGLAIGIALTAALAWPASHLLFGVTPFDPPSLAAASAVVLACAWLACYIPARRASRIAPADALRAD